MGSTSQPSPTRTVRSPTRLALYGLAAGAFLWALYLRLTLGAGVPLWVDETWTAMVATRPTWAGFWREVWLDANAPLYYLFITLWTGLFGDSNAALRAPSLIFTALAGLAPLAWRAPGLSFEARLAWGATLFLWIGGFVLSIDARVYPLLLLLATLQSIAFARLLHMPGRRAAWVWAALAAVSILAHYHAIVLAGVQGAMLLALRRRHVPAIWPAAFAFVPAAAWILYHLPRLAELARPEIAWYVRLDPTLWLGLTLYLIGPLSLGFALLLLAGLLALGLVGGPRDEPRVADADAALAAVALSGLVALALLLVVGTIRPSITARYLVPLVPPVLLGLVLLARRVARARLAYIFVIAMLLLPWLRPGALRDELAERSTYGFEPASRALLASRPDHLLFLWDHPAVPLMDRGSLAGFAGFFLARSGRPVEVTPIALPPGAASARAFDAAAAGAGERPALLWFYDIARRPELHGRPPAVSLLPGWRCRLYPRAHDRGLLACVRAGP